MAKLKPCCGVKPIIGKVNLIGRAVIITCPNCKRQVWKNSEVHGENYLEQAIDAWNRREK